MSAKKFIYVPKSLNASKMSNFQRQILCFQKNIFRQESNF